MNLKATNVAFYIGEIMKKIGIILLALLLLCSCTPKNEGIKNITVSVITEKAQQFEITTERKYLGDALKDEGLIKGENGQYGIFITEVNKIKADSKNEEWWCLTKENESVMTGVDKTPISNGDKFELTLKKGY